MDNKTPAGLPAGVLSAAIQTLHGQRVRTFPVMPFALVFSKSEEGSEKILLALRRAGHDIDTVVRLTSVFHFTHSLPYKCIIALRLNEIWSRQMSDEWP